MILNGSRVHCALNNFLKDYISQDYSKCQRGLSQRSRCFCLIHTLRRCDPLKGGQFQEWWGKPLPVVLATTRKCKLWHLVVVSCGKWSSMPCPALPQCSLPPAAPRGETQAAAEEPCHAGRLLPAPRVAGGSSTNIISSQYNLRRRQHPHRHCQWRWSQAHQAPGLLSGLLRWLLSLLV